jgi:hypothetical protein
MCVIEPQPGVDYTYFGSGTQIEHFKQLSGNVTFKNFEEM